MPLFTAYLVTLVYCPFDEVDFSDIIVQEPGRADRGRSLLSREPLPQLHYAFHSRPLLEECKGGVYGQHGPGDGVAVQDKAAQTCSRQTQQLHSATWTCVDMTHSSCIQQLGLECDMTHRLKIYRNVTFTRLSALYLDCSPGQLSAKHALLMRNALVTEQPFLEAQQNDCGTSIELL